MSRFICRVRVFFLGYDRGHRWQPVWSRGAREKGATIEVCLRCRENGWRV